VAGFVAHSGPGNARGANLRRWGVAAGVVVLLLAQFAPGEVAAVGASPPEPRPVRELRSILTAEHGAASPTGLAAREDGSLLVPHEAGGRTALLQLSPAGDRRATVELPGLTDPQTLAFDPARDRLVALDGGDLVAVTEAGLTAMRPVVQRVDADLHVGDPRGATFEPNTGTWLVLDGATGTIVKIPMVAGRPRPPSRIALPNAIGDRVQGIAFNPRDGLLYVSSPDAGLLYALDGSGKTQATYSLTSLDIRDLRALAFAPSADATDSGGTTHLYIADGGDATARGRVVEATLAAEVTTAAAVPEPPTLIQTLDVSRLNPPSPDPAGITYLPAADRLLLSDSEVEEMPIFQGANLFQVTRGGQLTDTGVTTPWSREPTGAGFNPVNGTLFVSDDDANRVFAVRPGPDGRYGTTDDARTSVNTLAFGSDDPEGTEFDPGTGHLMVVDGVNREVYDIDPVNEAFGDGDDVATHFDLEQHGVLDPEGIGVDTTRNNLVVVDRAGRKVYEVTRAGALLRVIDLRPISAKNPAGITVAPGSRGGTSYWIVERGVDNNTDPNENDGKVREIAATSGDTPPAVTFTEPTEGATVFGTVTIRATATDDQSVSQVQFLVDGGSIGTDTNGADGWSVAWDSATVTDGSHTLIARATDAAGQTGTDTNAVTVENVDAPPTVAIASPVAGAVVAGTTTFQATTADDLGVAQVQFRVDDAGIGTDTDGADGWSVAWDSTAVADGGHTLSAVATDTGGNTAPSAGVPFTVANSGAVISQDVPVAASMDDVEERSSNGRIWPATTDLDLVVDGSALQTVGLRFTGISPPQGARILNAYVQFQVDEVGTGPADLVVRAEAADDARAFTTARFDVTSRQGTLASTGWVPAPWPTVGARGPDQRTSNLAPVLQEVVDRPGWSSGRALVLVISGSGSRVAESFEGTFAPVLHIEYTTA
jgi:Bacterial Ig domain